LLPGTRRAELDAAARLRAAATLGVDESDATIATAIGQLRQQSGNAREHRSKTEVVFFAAALQDIHNQLRPIVEAGFTIDAVTTPCGALWSQARLRRPAAADQVQAFVALGAQMSALAFFANGFFLYGKDLNWGYAGTREAPELAMDREDLATRLSVELRRSFLYLKQFWEDDVSQLLLCGDMPEIRSLTAPLIDRLDIEVETLDTLDGIDPLRLPEPADRFSEQVAAFRLASGIAVEPAPINLLPEQDTAPKLNGTNRLLIAMGSAAAVAFAAFAYTRAGVDTASIVDRPSSIVDLRSSVDGPAPIVDRPAVENQRPATQDQALVAEARRSASEDRPTVTKDARSTPDAGRSTIDDRRPTIDPIVRSILYSESRQVALVDGHIVKPGDHVGQLVIGAIEKDGVVVITPAGLRKRIGLDRPTIAFGRQ
jgi:hypothetical protein